jgi:hypothetical protein
MINRREALLGMSAAALGVVATPSSALADKAADLAADAQLKEDLKLLKPWVLSEEGIPVILACVNQVGHPAAAALSPMNARITADFRETAAAWDRVLPHSPETDAGKTIQLLARKDFEKGGKP